MSFLLMGVFMIFIVTTTGVARGVCVYVGEGEGWVTPPFQINSFVVVEWSNHLTGDAKVVGSIPGTALMYLSKAFDLHCFSPPRCKWVPGRM